MSLVVCLLLRTVSFAALCFVRSSACKLTSRKDPAADIRMSTYLLSGLFLVAVLLTVRLCVFGLRVQVVVSSEKAVKLGVGRGGVSEQNRAVHASRSQEGMVAAEEINAEVDLVVCLRFGSFSIVALCFVGSSAAVVPGSRGDHVADVILSTYLLSGVFFFAMPPMMISRLMGRSVQAVALCEDREKWFSDAAVFVNETEFSRRQGRRKGWQTRMRCRTRFIEGCLRMMSWCWLSIVDWRMRRRRKRNRSEKLL